MIGFFTDPNLDELLYSACARYHSRARNLSKEATALDIFGNNRAKIVVDFPTRLDHLASQLPTATYSADRLIDSYTMLPFYSPFMPPRRHEAIRRDMRGDGGNSVHARLGILTSGIDVEYLRFCVACLDDDRKLHPEPFWHRIHQAPGVEVCPTHKIFLSNSEIRMRGRRNGQAFVTAKQATANLSLKRMAPRPLNPNDREHQILLKLAQDAAWILQKRIEVSSLDVLHRRYLRLLLERKLATYGGTVHHAQLKAQFLDYYSPALLEQFGCSMELRNHWLRRLINDWKRSHHPLHHLLLMQFLGCPAREFFQLSPEVEPFGKGPWPCLNAASEHYREACIMECQISQTHDITKRLKGTFQCECGFSYQRIGPDTTDEHRFKYSRILNYGEIWYGKLKEMLAADLGRKEMASVLGVSVAVITAEAVRLKKSIESNTPLTPRFEWRGAHVSMLDETQLRNTHRKKWRELVAENTNAARNELGRIAITTYHWLLKYDREWLEDNSPERRKNNGPGTRVDWSKRDEEYQVAVRETAEKMLTAAGRPVQASRTAIAGKLGILALVYKNPDKLPLTIKTLREVSESCKEFAIRRIRWAADCYRREQVLADQWKLQIRAAVGNKMVQDPAVKASMEDCSRMLREMVEAGWES